jgi:hypothetical protein
LTDRPSSRRSFSRKSSSPQSSTVKHFDPTDLTSTEDTCYVSSVPNYAPGGAVNLALRLNFDAFDPPGGGDGFIEIGLVAVHVK